MASGVTNRGKYNQLAVYFRGATAPTNLYAALITDADTPGPDTNTKADITEVASGNGYTTGGIQLNRDSTDFDVLTEDDTSDRALVQIKNLVWTASSGNLPSGDGARYLILTDDNETDADREVLVYWDLGAERVVSDGQTLTVVDAEIRLSEPS